MNRLHATIWAVLIGSAGAQLSAQQGTAKANPDQVIVTGCVATATEPNKYLLQNATVAGVVKSSSAMMPNTPASTSGNETKTYELVGTQAKAHVGHKVEVTGSLDQAKIAENLKKATATGATFPDVLNVKSVKMISSTCQ